jgi:maleylacetate reductase
MNFTCEQNASRVIFGAGKLSVLAAEVALLGFRNPVIISTPGHRDLAVRAQQLIGTGASIFDGAIMHVPTGSISAALAHVAQHGNDGCVCIGGSTTVGLAKAVALETGLKIIAVPTTYAGSEMTPIWGITRDGVKLTGRDNKVQPRTVIYDPELTLTLPPQISGASGINAMAHSVEALYAENRNPVISLLCEASISALAASLPVIVQSPRDMAARTQALYGSWLAGIALGAVGMAIHHKLCHVLGGSFSLPHAEVHSVMLPYSVAYNRDHAPEALSAIARALNTDSASVPGILHDLVASVGAPTALKTLGMQQGDLHKAAEIALAKPYYNPREVTFQGVLDLLTCAWAGTRP